MTDPLRSLIMGDIINKRLREQYPEFMKGIAEMPHPIRAAKFHEKAAGIAGYPPVEEMYRLMKHLLGPHGSFKDFRKRFPSTVYEQAATDLLYMQWKEPRIFRITEDLGNLLLKTGIQGTSREFLKLPFPVIYMEMPKNDLQVWFPNPVSGFTEHGELEGVYLLLEEIEGKSWLIFLCVSKSEIPLDDCLFTMPLIFEDGDLGPQLERRLEDVATRKDTEADRLNLEQFKAIFRWIMACLLYINCESADIKKTWMHEGLAKKAKKAKGPKKTKLKRQLRAISAEIHIVGGSIKIKRPASRSEPGDPTAVERSGPVLHWVRGHFRQVPYGKGKAKARLTWIKPFLRGEGAEAIRRAYEVE